FTAHGLLHRFDLGGLGFVTEENIGTVENPKRHYSFQREQAFRDSETGKRLAQGDLSLSILAERRLGTQFAGLIELAYSYEQIRFYREWTFGRNSIFRQPQRADLRHDRLEEDFSNLGLFLSHLRKTPKAKSAILEALKDLYEGVTDFEPVVEGGTVQVFF